jgi:hypothetical protein
MTPLLNLTSGASAKTVTDLFDINDNGHLGWPDLLASLFFGTVGVLAVLVLVGMAVGSLVLVLRGLVAAVRGLATAVRS